jgi:hypothetical protein
MSPSAYGVRSSVERCDRHVPSSISVWAAFCAMCSVSPMPLPDLMYHAPCGVMPAVCQSSSSFMLVPESSARETNSAPAAAKCLNASTAVAVSRTCAGSLDGPTMKIVMHDGSRARGHQSCTLLQLLDCRPTAKRDFPFRVGVWGPRQIHALYPCLGATPDPCALPVSGGHARSMRFTRGWASGGED